jgi:hypothetical protein
MGRMCANRTTKPTPMRDMMCPAERVCEANIFSRGEQALRFRCVVVMTDEMYEAVQRENAWDDEACGDRIARVDVVDDVCGMVIHFIEVRNADENRRVLRPGARWLMETAK